MWGSTGCVVTQNKLFSNGNFIRSLETFEIEQLKKYKNELVVFRKKINEAFMNAEKVQNINSTIPPVPIKPIVPSFCTGKDTTLYIFGGCTIQNNKVYVGRTLARDLNEEEKKLLEQFVTKITAQKMDTSIPFSDPNTGLEFCTEF
uniref:Pepsin-I3 domain-containing protein n=1 Tax=Heterorhabditis bacteriophora TaxID=37862 RepID=A0A1I7XP67_HETBA